MDGATLLYRLRNLLNEPSDSEFLDNRTSYDNLFEAAIEATRRAKLISATQSITTVADQVAYTLNGDFLEMFLRNESGNFYIKYYDGTTTCFITFKEYEDVIYGNQTDSVAIPTHFSIMDDSLPSQVSGTVTSTAAAVAGQCTMTDTAGDFSDVNHGDIVHNTTDGSVGVVISKTSSTVLITALFGGTNNDWTSGDAYVIQPQGRMKLILDPPPSTAGHTITVYYIQRPAPVYSDYGMYRFSLDQTTAIVKYAAWLYKYRDREPNFGDAFYVAFERQFRKNARAANNKFIRGRVVMNLRKRV